MFSVPEGRAANQPLAVTTLRPPIGAPLPGAAVSLAVIGSPASAQSQPPRATAFPVSPSARASPARRCACSTACRTRRSVAVVLARVLARARGDLRGEEVRHQPVLIRRPDRAVAPQERRSRAFLAAEAERASISPSTNHLKPTGTSTSRRPSLFTTRSIMLLLTTVLPTATDCDHCGRLANRY